MNLGARAVLDATVQSWLAMGADADALAMLVEQWDPNVTTFSSWVGADAVPCNRRDWWLLMCKQHPVGSLQQPRAAKSTSRVSAKRLDQVRALMPAAVDYSNCGPKVAGVVRTSVATLRDAFSEAYGEMPSTNSMEQALRGLRAHGWLLQLTPGSRGHAADHVLSVPARTLPDDGARRVLVSPDDLKALYFAAQPSRTLTAIPHTNDGSPHAYRSQPAVESHEGPSRPPGPSGSSSPPPPRTPKQAYLINDLPGGRSTTSPPPADTTPPPTPRPPAPRQSPAGPGAPVGSSRSRIVRVDVDGILLAVHARPGDAVDLDPHADGGPVLTVRTSAAAGLAGDAQPTAAQRGDAPPVEAGRNRVDRRVRRLLAVALQHRARRSGTDTAKPPADLTPIAMRVGGLPEAACLPGLIDAHGTDAVEEALSDLYRQMGPAMTSWAGLADSHFVTHADELPELVRTAAARIARETQQARADIETQASQQQHDAAVDQAWVALPEHERDRLLADAEAQTRQDLHIPSGAPLSIGARKAVEGLARQALADRVSRDPTSHSAPAPDVTSRTA